MSTEWKVGSIGQIPRTRSDPGMAWQRGDLGQIETDKDSHRRTLPAGSVFEVLNSEHGLRYMVRFLNSGAVMWLGCYDMAPLDDQVLKGFLENQKVPK